MLLSSLQLYTSVKGVAIMSYVVLSFFLSVSLPASQSICMSISASIICKSFYTLVRKIRIWNEHFKVTANIDLDPVAPHDPTEDMAF